MEYTIDQLKPILLANIANNDPAWIWGAPGIGKSELGAWLANELGMFLCDFRANLRESIDMRGLPAPDLKAGITKWLRPNDLPFVGNDNFPDNTLLFIDEGNTNPQVFAVMMQLVLDRRIGEHVLKPGVRIIAAGNRRKDRASGSSLPTALADRFFHYTAKPDATAVRQHFARIGVHEFVQAFLGFRPMLVHKMPEGDAQAFATPRGWEKVAKYCGTVDSDILYSVAAAKLGEDVAGEFVAFIRVYNEVPRLADIVSDPFGAKLPDQDQAAALWATATMCSRGANRGNIEAIAEYLSRLPAEYQTMALVDAVKRDEGLKETKPFVDWAIANQRDHV